MAKEQDVFHLPVKYLDYKDPEAMTLAIYKNFREVEHMLSLLQGYVKTATGAGVKDLPVAAGVWDRAGAINPDGTFSSTLLTDKLVGLAHDLQIAAEAVTEVTIAVNAITANKIAVDAVTEAKIADAAVTALKLAQQAVTTDKLADAAVTDMKLAAGAVSEGKTNWSTHLIY